MRVNVMDSVDALRAVKSRTIPRRPRRVVALHLSKRKVLLGTVDLLFANLALAAALGWRLGYPLRQILAEQPLWYAILTGVWLAAATLLGSYDLRRAARLKAGTATGAVTSLLTAVAYLLIPYVTPPLPTSRLSLIVFLGTMVGAVTVWRAFYAVVLVQPTLRRKALVIGAGWSGQTIAEVISDRARTEYDLVGFIDDDPNKQGKIIAGLPVLGTRAELDTVVRQTGTSEIIVAITQPDQMRPEMLQALIDCHEHGVHVTEMPVLFEQMTGRVPVEHAGRNLHIVLPLNGSPSRLHRGIKLMFDTTIGVVGLAVTGVLLPFVWLAQRLESTGPVFYTQARVGRGGQPFALIKFRTMVADAEANGPHWAEENDWRATRVGRVMRRLHIDEIPQAINILRRELSFIGPRPERPEFVIQLEKQIPPFRLRHSVRPGVTGWAQVNYGYGASVEEALLKLQYDLYYIKQQSLWLELVILVKTVGHILTLRGR